MSKLRIHRTEFPFVDTKEGRVLIRKAAVNLDHVEKKAPNETKRFAYLMCKAACGVKKVEFAFTWEEFIRLVDPGVIDNAEKLLKSMRKADKKALAEAEKKAKAAAAKKAAAEKKAKEAAEKKAKDQTGKKEGETTEESDNNKAGDSAKGSDEQTDAGDSGTDTQPDTGTEDE